MMIPILESFPAARSMRHLEKAGCSSCFGGFLILLEAAEGMCAFWRADSTGHTQQGKDHTSSTRDILTMLMVWAAPAGSARCRAVPSRRAVLHLTSSQYPPSISHPEHPVH